MILLFLLILLLLLKLLLMMKKQHLFLRSELWVHLHDLLVLKLQLLLLCSHRSLLRSLLLIRESCGAHSLFVWGGDALRNLRRVNAWELALCLVQLELTIGLEILTPALRVNILYWCSIIIFLLRPWPLAITSSARTLLATRSWVWLCGKHLRRCHLHLLLLLLSI